MKGRGLHAPVVSGWGFGLGGAEGEALAHGGLEARGDGGPIESGAGDGAAAFGAGARLERVGGDIG